MSQGEAADLAGLVSTLCADTCQQTSTATHTWLAACRVSIHAEHQGRSKEWCEQTHGETLCVACSCRLTEQSHCSSDRHCPCLCPQELSIKTRLTPTICTTAIVATARAGAGAGAAISTTIVAFAVIITVTAAATYMQQRDKPAATARYNGSSTEQTHRHTDIMRSSSQAAECCACGRKTMIAKEGPYSTYQGTGCHCRLSSQSCHRCCHRRRHRQGTSCRCLQRSCWSLLMSRTNSQHCHQSLKKACSTAVVTVRHTCDQTPGASITHSCRQLTHHLHRRHPHHHRCCRRCCCCCCRRRRCCLQCQ